MPKKIVEAKVIGQHVLNNSTKLIEVYAPELAELAVPGQFVNVQVFNCTAPLLRRPFGVAAVNKKEGTITMIYRIIGEATKLLAEYCSGDKLSIVGPLGRGFDMNAQHPLIVGGGLGLAPLLFLASAFGKGKAEIVMGGRCADELFWTKLYEEYCPVMHLTTDDGSCGTKGTVMAVLPELLASGRYDALYVCGPVPMMKAVAEAAEKYGVKCQVSLEKYMACGLVHACPALAAALANALRFALTALYSGLRRWENGKRKIV